MGQARRRGTRDQRIVEALAHLPQHQRHIAMVFDDSAVGLRMLQQQLSDARSPFHDTLNRNVPILRSQGATFIVFLGTEGYSGGTSLGARSLRELLDAALPALFQRLHQKRARACAVIVAVDNAIEEPVRRRLAELQPGVAPDGQLQNSPALDGFMARRHAERLEPIFDGTTLEPDHIVLSAPMRENVRAHFNDAETAWAALGNPTAAALTMTPFAERLLDGTLRLYTAKPSGEIQHLDVPRGEWTTHFEQARAMAGTAEWPSLDAPMHALHGGALLSSMEYGTRDGSRARALIVECVTEWTRFGMGELRAMQEAGREPFLAEIVGSNVLRMTAYFPSREFRSIDVPPSEWDRFDATNHLETEGGDSDVRIEERPILAPPAKGETVPFFLHRSIIELGSVERPLEALALVSQSLDSARPFRHRVMVEVGGYNDDPRQLWEIAEVRDYFRRLFEAWPHWLYILEADKSELLLFLRLICTPNLDSSVPAGMVAFRDADEVQAALIRLCEGVQSLFDRWGLSEQHDERAYAAHVVNELLGSLAGVGQRVARPPS